jgi:hypothetical protein
MGSFIVFRKPTEQDKVKLAITAGLLIIMIVAGNNALKTMKKVKEHRKRKLETPLKDGLPTGSIPSQPLPYQALYTKFEKIGKDISLKRDPFSKALIDYDQESSLVLEVNGIAWNRENPLAVIGDKLVEVVDTIGKYVVIKIKEDSVTLSDGVNYLELELKE